MGSFAWDSPCCYQYYDGQPLSVALTDSCGSQILPCVESDFALGHHPRHLISGRRFRREYFEVYHPNAYYGSCCCLPSIPWGPMYRCGSRDGFFRNLGSVTIEEQEYRPMVRYVRTVSPIIRPLKVRRRPSSCVDIREGKKDVDIHREERYEYNYNFNLPQEPAKPPPIVRPPTTNAATVTDIIPKRPLTMTDHDSSEQQYQQASRKEQRKDFIQRMNVQNGTTQKTFNALNTNADRGRNYVTIESTSIPSEAIVTTTKTSSSEGFTSAFASPSKVQESSQSRYYIETT
ncbi:unnamed protein product [Rotaria sp. Silwood2]|nr:unnamed protein product [Rotaria sp. Silwood2]CAF2638133.1 unnamed protein product [Rotaria sp. Silwood2]CAF2878560.1 unnamed protein product [Rotaria sp. Silwood2]CAF3047547.1 unnamed protein product [Rotaria sp. Silwood2]CAF3983558.1 unnamed protein product [Rotaria sp. Silwood2]